MSGRNSEADHLINRQDEDREHRTGKHFCMPANTHKTGAELILETGVR